MIEYSLEMLAWGWFFVALLLNFSVIYIYEKGKEAGANQIVQIQLQNMKEKLDAP